MTRSTKPIRPQDEIRKGSIGHNVYVGGPYVKGPPGTPILPDSSVPPPPLSRGTWKQKAWDALAELADAKAAITARDLEIKKLREQVDGKTFVCNVCGGPWGLTRPMCDYTKRGRCEGGYLVTKRAYAALSEAQP